MVCPLEEQALGRDTSGLEEGGVCETLVGCKREVWAEAVVGCKREVLVSDRCIKYIMCPGLLLII